LIQFLAINENGHYAANCMSQHVFWIYRKPAVLLRVGYRKYYQPTIKVLCKNIHKIHVLRRLRKTNVKCLEDKIAHRTWL